MQPTYRIQDDAGPVAQPVAAGPVIDMPPTYNPTWQTPQAEVAEGSETASPDTSRTTSATKAKS
jgi:hypothetical protein